jgi:SAM-dependent methyltransferase
MVVSLVDGYSIQLVPTNQEDSSDVDATYEPGDEVLEDWLIARAEVSWQLAPARATVWETYNRVVSEDGGYLLDNQHVEAGRRLEALSALFDPTTYRHFDHLGVARGWRVWEVGAGGTSVPRWLARRVGAQGRVVASDIDTSWLELDSSRSYEILRHDVSAEPAPDGAFDLIHARLVLVHLPERDRVIASLIESLKPRGWLLLEEADPELQPLVCPDDWGDDQHLANTLKMGFRRLLSERGADLSFGRRTPRMLREAGLVDVESDAYFPMGGAACDELERATVEQIRQPLVERGLASGEEIERHLANVNAHRLDLATSPMISAWGRRAR